MATKKLNQGQVYVQAQLTQEIETRVRMINESRTRPKDFPVEARLLNDAATEAIAALDQMQKYLDDQG